MEENECPINYEGRIKRKEASVALLLKKYERGIIFMYLVADDDYLMMVKRRHSYTEMMENRCLRDQGKMEGSWKYLL